MESHRMSPPPAVKNFIDAAQRFVERAIHVRLDGSEASLAFVDHYIAETRRGGAIKDDVLALIAPAIGAYFGELAIGRFGGAWRIEREGDDPAAWRVELAGAAPLTFSPVGKAAAALRGEEVDGYDASFATSDELLAPLGEALAATPPVDERYFYSLTGRLETLECALDILAELMRRKREHEN
jgi:hypothetical protein